MIRIKALPKYAFESYFNNTNIVKYTDACFISILDCDNNDTKYDLNMHNFLQVRMWDVEYDVNDKITKPSDIELIKIVDFINFNITKNTKHYFVHCSAGVSRSGAVTMFIKDKLYGHIDNQLFYNDNKQINPNLYILNRLKEIDDNNNGK